MHVKPIVTAVQATLTHQAAVGTEDPAVEAAVAQLVAALAPALQVAAMQLAEQAAAEVRAQLPDQTVDVILVDGDPTLRIGDAPARTEQRAAAEDADARITLRLPPSLKALIEDAAQNAGDSVNQWVVDALGKRANRRAAGRNTWTESFDL